MSNLSFTCPRLALALLIRLIFVLVFLCLTVFVCWDLLILAIPFVVSVLAMGILITTSLCNFSFCVFRSLILVKFDDECIKNAFCKIRYDEIKDIGYENLEFSSTRGNKKFCIVMIINGKESTFKNYDTKKSICIPLNNKTKKAFIKNAPFVAEKFNIAL